MRLFSLLLAFSCIHHATAQRWVDLLLDDESNLQEVKAAFDEEWQGRSYQRGRGWKQFNRWYWFMEQRTWPSGDRPDPSVFLAAMEEVRAMRAMKSGQRDEAVWTPMGPSTWTSTSYNPGNGRVNVVALDPFNPQVIYAGTPSAGLWRSADNGSTWNALFTDLPSMGVSGIALHPDSVGTLFIATGDGDGSDTYSAGVLKSTDHGATWQTTGLNWNVTQSRTTRALRMHPNDPQTMLCAASNGLQRTLDGGVSWQQVSSGSFRDVEFMPGDTTLAYASTNRFYRSVNGLQAFSTSGINGLPAPNLVGRMAIAVTPADPLIVYALCSDDNDNSYLGLYRSNDGGISFTLQSDSPNLFCYADDGDDSGGQAWYDMALAVDPVNPDIVYVGGINVWKSTDGGLSWEIQSHWVFPSDIGYTHADIHSLDILDGRLFCGSDGGIFVSDNAGDTWDDLSAGLDITQFYRLGGSELLPDLIMAGAQDNGSNRYLNGAWTHVFGADGMEAAVDPYDPGIVYSTSQNGGLRRSDNGGLDWDGIGDQIPEDGAWVTPFVMDPTWPGRIIAGYWNLWASDNRGDDFYPLTNWDEEQFVRAIAIAPNDGSVIYAARSGLVERSTDMGWTWQDIRAGLPNLTPTSIAVHHADPMHLWISFSGTTAGHKVYESVNGGLSWTNRSTGLPNVAANSVVVQRDSPNGLYLGTDMGVFYRDDYTGIWEPYGVGLPNVVASEVEINMAAGKLRAATYGRGIWEVDLYFSPFAGIAELLPDGGPRVIALDLDGRFAVQGAERITRLRVLDAIGRELLLFAGNASSRTIDLSMQPGGAYIIEILTPQGRFARRVVR
ncbi:MAG: hypothetical protein IPM46_11910 [Flavobacteriales bacterium]|nr:hypothetical protein [Flavobacteriales bacterium]